MVIKTPMSEPQLRTHRKARHAVPIVCAILLMLVFATSANAGQGENSNLLGSGWLDHIYQWMLDFFEG